MHPCDPRTSPLSLEEQAAIATGAAAAAASSSLPRSSSAHSQHFNTYILPTGAHPHPHPHPHSPPSVLVSSVPPMASLARNIASPSTPSHLPHPSSPPPRRSGLSSPASPISPPPSSQQQQQPARFQIVQRYESSLEDSPAEAVGKTSQHHSLQLPDDDSSGSEDGEQRRHSSLPAAAVRSRSSRPTAAAALQPTAVARSSFVRWTLSWLTALFSALLRLCLRPFDSSKKEDDRRSDAAVWPRLRQWVWRSNRRKLGTALSILFLVVYLRAVIFSCTARGGGRCRFLWPDLLCTPADSIPPPAAPFTLVSLLRDMSPESLEADKASFVIQWNALHSWAELLPPSRIIVFMDTASSCARLMAEGGAIAGVRCFVVPCWHPEHKRPLLDCLFRKAHAESHTELIAYVNGDILLHADVGPIVNQVAAWFPSQFLIVSRRTDTVVPPEIFETFASTDSRTQVAALFERARSHGSLHSEFGIDLFVYPRSLFPSSEFPPFLAGVYRWDNWLLSQWILSPSVAVVDITRRGLVVHQELGKQSHQGRTGAQYNDALAKASSGSRYRVGNIRNADYILAFHSDDDQIEEAAAPFDDEAIEAQAQKQRSHEHRHKHDAAPRASSFSQQGLPSVPLPSNSLRFRLLPNNDASIEVLIAQRADPKTGWLAVISVSHWDLADAGLADNWICWAERAQFRAYIFLAEDRVAGQMLRDWNQPVLQFDDASDRASLDSSLRWVGGAAEDFAASAPASVGLSSAASLSVGTPSIVSFDFQLFRTEFLNLVLKAGFSFCLMPLASIPLEDPLQYLEKHRFKPASTGDKEKGGPEHVYGFASWAAEQEAQSRSLPSSIPDSPDADSGSSLIEYDIHGVGSSTALDSHFLAVSASSPWGRYLWAQIYACEQNNGEILLAQAAAAASGVDTPNAAGGVVDCLPSVLARLRKKVVVHVLPPLLFPRHSQYFVEQSSHIAGALPIVILDDEPLSLLNTPSAMLREGETAVSASLWNQHYATRVREYKAGIVARWKEWKLLAVDLTSSASGSRSGVAAAGAVRARARCLRPEADLRPLPSAPVSVAEWDAFHAKYNRSGAPPLPRGQVGLATGLQLSPLDFNFRIRVLTFDRPQSLARLLESLSQVDFGLDGGSSGSDRIALEISIDSPADLSDEASVQNWRLVCAIAEGFTWSWGTLTLVRQPRNIGLTGQWTLGFEDASSARAQAAREVILFLEDDMTLVKDSWRWIKAAVQSYWLNPHNYSPTLFGLSLQSQHTILGESLGFRYGSRAPSDLLDPSALFYRYQLIGTWGTLFFPGHWAAFTAWLKTVGFQHTQGTSSLGFKPCVPGLISNGWWSANPRRVWSQWFVRFAAETGWSGLYTNFPSHASLVVNYREGGLNFKDTRGPMNPAVESPIPPEYLRFPPLASLSLRDFWFREHKQHPSALAYQMDLVGAVAVANGRLSSHPASAALGDECYVIKDAKTAMKRQARVVASRSIELARLEDLRNQAIDIERRKQAQAESLASLADAPSVSAATRAKEAELQAHAANAAKLALHAQKEARQREVQEAEEAALRAHEQHAVQEEQLALASAASPKRKHKRSIAERRAALEAEEAAALESQ